MENSMDKPGQSNYRHRTRRFTRNSSEPPKIKILVKTNASQHQQSTSSSSTMAVATASQPPSILEPIKSMSFERSNFVKSELAYIRPTIENRPQRMKIATKSLVPQIIQSELQLPDPGTIARCRKFLKEDMSFGEMSELELMLLNASNETTPSTTGGQSFCIVSAISLEGVGKSSLLNHMAGVEVFDTHQKSSSIFGHLTQGIDLHITAERVFLLDPLPLLSTSVIDDFLRGNPASAHPATALLDKSQGSSNSFVGFDLSEPENLAYIYSLQLVTFLLTICDHVVLVLDPLALDAYLLKLIATAVVMVGESMPKANLIIHQRKTTTGQERSKCQRLLDLDYPTNESCDIVKRLPIADKMERNFEETIKAVFGQTSVEFIDDQTKLMKIVLAPPSRQLVGNPQSASISHSSERAWLHSVQKYWEKSIRKTTLFNDYARCLP